VRPHAFAPISGPNVDRAIYRSKFWDDGAKYSDAIHDLDQFVPAPGLAGGHRMTLYTWGRPRYLPQLPPPQPRFFDVAPNTRVLAHCHWQPDPRQHPTVLALHGLEGSSTAHYMRGLADKGYSKGFNVVLLNQRNCGGTEHLSEGLYHSGLSSDPAAVIQELVELDGLTRVAVIGYSLGGNIALRLAGAHGPHGPANALIAVCAVSPTMDLALCVDALERPENLIYEFNFVRKLRGRMRRKARALPGRFDLSCLASVRTVRGFDEAFTAPYHGFRDADDYYYRASSLRVAHTIKIPTLIVSAEDDPFVPPKQFHAPSVVANPAITVAVTKHGGHCGFFTRAETGFDGYWAEQIAIEFAEHHDTSSPP
jgi:predicted alpha/beta-fold hydrolase